MNTKTFTRNSHGNRMSSPEQNHRPTPELLAELTGRPADEFEVPEDVPMPAPETLDTHDAAAFYSGEK